MNIVGTSAIKFQGGDNVVDFKVKAKVTTRKSNARKGEKQEVFPFKTEEDLNAMHTYFVENKRYRDDLMFILGINVGLRAGDLLALKWKQVFPYGFDEVANEITIRESKTDKWRTFYLNESAKTALLEYFARLKADYERRIEKARKRLERAEFDGERYADEIERLTAKRDNIGEEYVFASRKGDGHVEVRPAGDILKKAAQAVGIKYNVGTHSMRKTFGYWQLKAHRNDAMFVCQLQEMFNHSTPQITLRYCGLASEEMEQYYNDVCLL